jgi:UDP-N-acetylglucosamine 2-epimerase (non-hydrolysing)
MTATFKVATIFGTRPEAIKLMPVLRALERHHERLSSEVISTSQHTDLLVPLITALGLKVDHNLGVLVPGQSLDQLLGRLLSALDPVLNVMRPDCLVVQGDTTTALAGAIAGFHRRLPVFHVEAGLRSGDIESPFPEEMNRRLISSLATHHMAATPAAASALAAEGKASERIVMTGNPIVDAVHIVKRTIAPSLAVAQMLDELRARKILVVTSHRRENFGQTLRGYLTVLRDFTLAHPDVVLLFPVHPNPAVRAECATVFETSSQIRLLDPMIYPDFLHVLDQAWMIASDSGGIQEEAATLRKPILILRDTTERPEVVNSGYGRLVGHDPKALFEQLERAYRTGAWTATSAQSQNPFGDGDAGDKIADCIIRVLCDGYGKSNSKL